MLGKKSVFFCFRHLTLLSSICLFSFDSSSYASLKDEDIANYIAPNFKYKFKNNEQEQEEEQIRQFLRGIGSAAYSMRNPSVFDPRFYDKQEPDAIEAKLRNLHAASDPFEILKKISDKVKIEGFAELLEEMRPQALSEGEHPYEFQRDGYFAWENLKASFCPDDLRIAVNNIAKFARNNLVQLNDEKWKRSSNILLTDAHKFSNRMRAYFKYAENKLQFQNLVFTSSKWKTAFANSADGADELCPNSGKLAIDQLATVIHHAFNLIKVAEGAPGDLEIESYIVANPATGAKYINDPIFHHFDWQANTPCSYLFFIVLDENADEDAPEMLTLAYPLAASGASASDETPSTENVKIVREIRSQTGAGYFVNQRRSGMVHGKKVTSTSSDLKKHRDILVLRIIEKNPYIEELKAEASQRKAEEEQKALKEREKKRQKEINDKVGYLFDAYFDGNLEEQDIVQRLKKRLDEINLQLDPFQLLAMAVWTVHSFHCGLVPDGPIERNDAKKYVQIRGGFFYYDNLFWPGNLSEDRQREINEKAKTFGVKLHRIY